MPNNQLLTRIDGMESELVQFTMDLLKVRSISPDAEYREIVSVLNGAYASLGLDVKWMTASEAQIVKKTGFKKYPRHNILGRLKGSGGGSTLAIFSHMDTVDAADLDAWKSDPFTPELRDGKIFGLGAMDARCDLGCAFFDAKSLKEAGIKLKGDLIIIG